MPPPDNRSSAENTFPPHLEQFSSPIPLMQAVSMAAMPGFMPNSGFPPLFENILKSDSMIDIFISIELIKNNAPSYMELNLCSSN